MLHGVAISLPSLVPERLDFALRDFATNGDCIFHAEVVLRIKWHQAPVI
jgi:hypothetical protein